MGTNKTSTSYNGLEIAIIGIACRYPGARDWRAFWNNLVNGVESLTTYTDEELLASGLTAADIRDPNYVKSAFVLDQKDCFDSNFFGYKPTDASFLNPQNRILYECAWEALEDAGYNSESANGSIGLFAGAGEDLNWRVYTKLKHAAENSIDGITLVSLHSKDYLLSQLAYKLNLNGPVFTMQTACSTSLVAINLACKSLLLGESSMALAGGVSINTLRQRGYVYKEGLIESVDGHCRAFDESSTGTVWSEGVGLVVLKRLEDARRDGDNIYAVIKGSSINNDGSRKVGFTAPSVEGQVECIKKAQRMAGVEPESIGYIEAHGTGTKIGDPIEIESLNIAFNKNTEHSCAVGSVKTNIGHTDSAAGVAGLIKAALCLKFGKIPASLNFTKPNPQINFAGGPFHINTETKEWTRTGGKPLRAGVSSFGVGGTNAHAVLEEAPAVEETPSFDGYRLAVLSAKTENALIRYGAKLKAFLATNDVNPDDLSYTLLKGRRHFTYRKAIAFRDTADLVARLEGGIAKDQVLKAAEEQKTVVFMFPGQGSQYNNMGHDLYTNVPLIRAEMDKGFALLEQLTGEDFKAVLFPASADSATINHTKYTQPLIFLTEYALARYMLSLGLEPDCMIGHSIGEYVAACLANVFSFEDALRLVVKRGALMNSVAPGAMLSVPMEEEPALGYLGADLSLAAVNSPGNVVFSGPFEAIDALKERLDREGQSYIQLRTSHAFHSSMLDGVTDEFRRELEAVTFQAPERAFVSNLTGRFITPAEATSPDYWVRHMREAVRFSQGIRTIVKNNNRLVFVEVGAGRSLSLLLMQHKLDKFVSVSAVNLMRSPKETTGDTEYLFNGIGQLWGRGVQLNWDAVQARGRKISLPTYSFEPVKYPAEVDIAEGAFLKGNGLSADELPDLANWFYIPCWKRLNMPANAFESIAPDSLYATLIFMDDYGIGEELAQKVKAAGGRVLPVRAGTAFANRGADGFEINADKEEDFERLFQHINDAQKDINLVVVYLWGVNPRLSAPLTIDRFNSKQDFLYDNLLSIARAIAACSSNFNVAIKVVTNNLFDVTGGEKVLAENGMILGPLNTIPLEYINIRCHGIELSFDEGPGGIGAMASDLFKEIQLDVSDSIVAYRKGQRWIRTFEPQRLDGKAGAARFRDGGVYLISGGTGGIGLAIAEHIASEAKCTILLTGRSYFPPKESWAREMSELPDFDPFKKILVRLKGIEDAGANVVYCQVDVADPEKMKAFAGEVRNNYGKVHGMVHSAGISDGKMIDSSFKGMATPVVRPKINGSILLKELFADAEFMFLCSSMGSVVPFPGQTAYAAVNNFLDAFAHGSTNEGFPTTAINWDGWRDSGLAISAYVNQSDFKNFNVKDTRIFNHHLFKRKVRVSDTETVYVSYFSSRNSWFLREHRISDDTTLMPGTGYLELIRAAFEQQEGEGGLQMRNATFFLPMPFYKDEEREVHTVYTRNDEGYTVEVRSRTRTVDSLGDWATHATATVRKTGLEETFETLDLSQMEQLCGEEYITKEANLDQILYTDLYGPRWNNRNWVRKGSDHQLAALELEPQFLSDLERFKLHPALLDTSTGFDREIWASDVFLPFRYEKLTILAPLPASFYSFITRDAANSIRGDELKYDIRLVDGNGRVLVAVDGFTRMRVAMDNDHKNSRISELHKSTRELPKWLLEGISDEEGKEAFGRLSKLELPQIFVFGRTKDLNLFVKDQVSVKKQEVLEMKDTSMLAPTDLFDRPQILTEYEPAGSRMEQLLVETWQSFFGYNKVGVNDDFFELGGDSLKVMAVVSIIQKTLNVPIPLKEFFKSPTIKGLAVYLEGVGAVVNDDQLHDGASDAGAQVSERSRKIEKISEEF